jgi:hypothetical protein
MFSTDNMPEVTEFLDKVQVRLDRGTERTFFRLPLETKRKISAYWDLRFEQERCLATNRFSDFKHFTPEQQAEIVGLANQYKARTESLQANTNQKTPPRVNSKRKVHGKKYKEPRKAAVPQPKAEGKKKQKQSA